MFVCIKKIVGIIDAVSAFQKHGNMKFFIEHMRCFFHRCSIRDLYSGEIFCFRHIWCDDFCKWKKFFLESFFRIFVHQAMTTGRYHDGIQNDVACLILTQSGSHVVHNLRRREHADLYCIRKNISKNTIELIIEKFRRYFLNAVNPGCILCGQGGDRTHCVNTVHDHCFDVGLDTCTTAAVTAGNC